MNESEWRAAIDDALRPHHFFVAPAWRLRVEHVPRETIAWEVFRGHLLDGSMTRERKTFEAWHMFLESAAEASGSAVAPAPLISLKFDATDRRLFVIRNILVHAWEAYESTPGVIDSRPVQKWAAELVGTIDLAARDDGENLRDEIGKYLAFAMLGTSKLPITSLETPLPAFSLGQIMYFHGAEPAASPHTDVAKLLTAQPLWFHPQAVELVLRNLDGRDLGRVAKMHVDAVRRSDAPPALISTTCRQVFRGLALTPATRLVPNLAEWLRQLASPDLTGPRPVVGDVSYMLRLLVRHLTAYDLVTFHNFGANYPDAYLLDALLKLLLELAEQHPEEFLPAPADHETQQGCKLLSRRALRQAWLLRKRYEGHRVPDSPTSMGETQRVLPEPFQRVADEQIVDPRQRRKTLFDNEPAESLLRPDVQCVWQLCVAELEQPAELRELGTGLFLDRPLGILKADGEVDRTPLFSYVAFSRSVAEGRLRNLYRWRCFASEDVYRRCLAVLETLPIRGVSAAELPGAERPGVVALEDARRAADDFVFLYTTGRSRTDFARAARVTHPSPLAQQFAEWTRQERPTLIIRTARAAEAALGRPFLTAFDRDLRPRWRLGAQAASGKSRRYDEAFGQEFLADGLFVEEV